MLRQIRCSHLSVNTFGAFLAKAKVNYFLRVENGEYTNVQAL